MRMPPIITLVPYQEVVGPLIGLEERDGAVFAEIGKYILVLPLEMKEPLSSLLGRKCGILRTDISGKSHLIRVLSDSHSDSGDNDRIRYQDGMQNSEEEI